MRHTVALRQPLRLQGNRELNEDEEAEVLSLAAVLTVSTGKLSLLPGNLPFWLSNQVDRLRKTPICTHSIPFYPEKWCMARFRLFAWTEVHAAPTCALR